MFGSASAQHATYSATSTAAYGQGGPVGAFEIAPDDRIGTPLKRRRLRAFLIRIVMLSVLGGSGYGLYEYQSIWMPWVTELTRERTAVITAKSSAGSQPPLPPLVQSPGAPIEPGSAAGPPVSGPAKPAGEALSPKPPAASSDAQRATAALPIIEPIKPQDAKSTAPSAAGASATVAAAAAPAASVPRASTPYQAPSETAGPAGSSAALNLRRAGAAGLHPDLSSVILARLSPADFQNAGAAINRAVTDVADDDVLVWPKQRKAGEAQFRVHFVAGAEQGCRRYVVTIAKDGWLTTALPMEKCGVRRKEARAQKS